MKIDIFYINFNTKPSKYTFYFILHYDHNLYYPYFKFSIASILGSVGREI